MKPLLLSLAVFTWINVAQAASGIDLTVTGLITPSACEPSLSSGGVYDLGKIAARDLNVDQPTQLPTHTLQLSITCDAPTLLALEPRDNRLGSGGEVGSVRFGLGLINESIPLGYMRLNLNSIVADGVSMYPIGSSGPSTWAPTSVLSHYFLSAFSLTPNPTVPAPVQQVTAGVLITPTIAPSETLPLTEAVPIDGSVTLSMHYL
ncbi:DUF1120 domain-containing protein [Pseudomonas sp. HN11]|uniref:DUF1120 domain-containing protein n=1 Tax=Pseudomonas sp. HN11 TaxID=1344094 RepID=UPI001F43AB90|nr:DUF1120 domain-containing protein [Pseudomonas sp. HN11]UII72531.1 DUF1120 domain-containing protein [Pseudomonas sp. HN11]